MRRLLAVALALTAALLTAPAPAQAADRGSYSVSGLGSRKQAVLNNGGTVLDLAIAMLETERMTTDYTYGDGKSGDAANFGIFKQNWHMIRQSVSQYSGYGANEYNAGAALNSNLGWDIQIRHAAHNKWGEYTWFAGHRNGETGLGNPNTQDIANYRNAIYWIRDQINSDSRYRTDDTRFWVNVPPI